MQNNYTTIYDLLILKFSNRFMEIEFWKRKNFQISLQIIHIIN